MSTATELGDASSPSHYMAIGAIAEQSELIALEMKMEQQAADEDEHGQEMRRLLGK